MCLCRVVAKMNSIKHKGLAAWESQQEFKATKELGLKMKVANQRKELGTIFIRFNKDDTYINKD